MIWLALAIGVGSVAWAWAFAHKADADARAIEAKAQAMRADAEARCLEAQARISDNVRAASRQVGDAAAAVKTLMSGPAKVENVNPPARPGFGQKQPHIIVDNDKPDPAA
jgi:regulator of protease activity HflC (stomatin/prohibitin superfamily)